MPEFRLPLAGDVSQIINPFMAFFRAVGSQIGLVNINLGRSANPDVEQEVLSGVASYGRQLGRTQDAVAVLLTLVLKDARLSEAEREAVRDFKLLFNNIAAVKADHTDKPVLRFKDSLADELESR